MMDNCSQRSKSCRKSYFYRRAVNKVAMTVYSWHRRELIQSNAT